MRRRTEGREVFYNLNLGDPKTRKLCELFETEKREKYYQQNKRLSWALQEFSKKSVPFPARDTVRSPVWKHCARATN